MIRMKDIAERVNTSRATVSLVLNNRGHDLRISEETQAKIIAAAREMGYYRNELARAVASGQTNVIGFINYGFRHEYWGRIFEGLSRVADANGYYIKHINILHINDLSIEEKAEAVVRKCVEQRLAGVICCLSPQELNIMFEQGLDKHGIKVCIVDNTDENNPCDSIASDDVEGCSMMVKHLVQKGHRRAALISHGYPQRPFARIRVGAFKAAGEKYGLEFDPDFECMSSNKGSIEPELIKDLLMKKNLPELLVCCTDVEAYLAIQTATGMGLKVPEDISVTGFGDLSYSMFCSPALTTVRQFFDKMGEAAAEKLFDAIKSKKTKRPLRYLIPTEVIKRNSVKDIS